MKIRKIILSLAAILLLSPVFGQSIRDLRINEVYIKNIDNYTDEFGHRVPWVEIFNTAYNTVNIGGCYLTDDTTGLTAVKKAGAEVPEHWYRIPKGDPKTAIPQRSYLIFFMDNQPLYGVFHVNFDLRTSPTHYVALVSSNGKDIIDIFEYPVALRDTSISFGCFNDGSRDSVNYLPEFTPGSTNFVARQATKEEKLKKDDPYGFGLALISMAVVFTALILIYVMLKIFGSLSSRRVVKASKAHSQGTPVSGQPMMEKSKADLNAPNSEEAAAIAMALHLHFNSMHDEESEVLTIEMPSARYSPWAQKGNSMRRTPKVK